MSFYREGEIRCPHCDRRMTSTSKLIAHEQACPKKAKP